jgi:hypothetical protein
VQARPFHKGQCFFICKLKQSSLKRLSHFTPEIIFKRRHLEANVTELFGSKFTHSFSDYSWFISLTVLIWSYLRTIESKYGAKSFMRLTPGANPIKHFKAYRSRASIIKHLTAVKISNVCFCKLLLAFLSTLTFYVTKLITGIESFMIQTQGVIKLLVQFYPLLVS